MITYLLQVTVCLGLFYAFYHIALRRETLHAANRIYLLATLFAGLVIPLLEIRLDHPAAAPVLQSAIQAGTRIGTWPEIVIPAPATSAIDWASVAMGAYAVISILLLFRMASGIARITRLQRGGQRVEIAGNSCIMADRITTPFSFGKFIYLPALMQLDGQALRQVLRHEQAHVRQRHSVDVLLVEGIVAICWIVPFVYLYRRAIREVHEYAADAAVLRDTGWEPYARLLIAQRRPPGQPALAHSFHSSTLKNRIMMMHRHPSARGAAFKYAGILPVLAMAVTGFSFTQPPGPDLSAAAGPVPLATRAFAAGTVTSDDPVMPLFPGCGSTDTPEARSCSQEKLVIYMGEHLTYPETMWKDKTEGQVIVRFTVDENGWVRDAAVVKGLVQAADNATLDIIAGMNMRLGPWTPGVKDGLPVATTLMLPVDFRLPETGVVANPAQVDQMPVYPGCNALPATEQDVCTSTRLGQFIFTQLKYPEDERKRGVGGRGIVTFVIGTDGRIRDISLDVGVSPGIDAEILRIAGELAKLPNPWTPAMLEGKPVAMEMTLPILFKLNE